MTEHYPQATQPDFLFDSSGEPGAAAQWAHRKSTRILIAGAAMIGLAITSGAIGEAQPKPVAAVEQPTPKPSFPPDKPLPERTDFADGSMRTNPEADLFVGELVAQPPSSLFEKYRKLQAKEVEKRNYPHWIINPHPSWTPEDNDTLGYNVNKAIAHKYNQTLHDPRATQKAMRGLKVKTNSFDDYLQAVRPYLKQFGVDVKIFPTNASKDLLDEEVLPPSTEVLESPIAKYAMYNLVESFANLSQEFIDMSMGKGDKTIYLSQNAPAKPDPKDPTKTLPTYAGKAYIQGDHNKFNLNLATGFSTGVVNHELSHLTDAALMGDGKTHDIDFPAMNKDVPYREDDLNKPYWFKTYKNTLDNDRVKVFNLRIAGKLNEACQFGRNADKELKALGQQILFMNDYAGSKNVLEDKAVTGGALLNNSYDFGVVTSRQTPWLRGKAMLWLDRIAAFRPGVAAFIIESRNKGYHEQPIAQDCNTPLNTDEGNSK